MECYKVLDENLKSLGLKPRGHAVPIIQYVIGQWTHPLEPVSDDPNEGGGLWVTPARGQARHLAKYMWKKYHRRTRIFLCFIGEALCQPSSYRVKTDKVMLVEEVFLLKRK